MPYLKIQLNFEVTLTNDLCTCLIRICVLRHPFGVLFPPPTAWQTLVPQNTPLTLKYFILFQQTRALVFGRQWLKEVAKIQHKSQALNVNSMNCSCMQGPFPRIRIPIRITNPWKIQQSECKWSWHRVICGISSSTFR